MHGFSIHYYHKAPERLTRGRGESEQWPQSPSAKRLRGICVPEGSSARFFHSLLPFPMDQFISNGNNQSMEKISRFRTASYSEDGNLYGQSR
jgi:hypothetical protein